MTRRRTQLLAGAGLFAIALLAAESAWMATKVGCPEHAVVASGAETEIM